MPALSLQMNMPMFTDCLNRFRNQTLQHKPAQYTLCLHQLSSLGHLSKCESQVTASSDLCPYVQDVGQASMELDLPHASQQSLSHMLEITCQLSTLLTRRSSGHRREDDWIMNSCTVAGSTDLILAPLRSDTTIFSPFLFPFPVLIQNKPSLKSLGECNRPLTSFCRNNFQKVQENLCHSLSGSLQALFIALMYIQTAPSEVHAQGILGMHNPSFNICTA